LSDLREKLSDFVVRRVVDVAGEANLVFSTRKKQAPIKEPAEYGLEGFETKYVTSRDGAKIGIWHKPPSDPTQPIYVAFHGRKGNWGFASSYPAPKSHTADYKDQGYRHQWLKAMADSGAGVIAVHTRGFGASNFPETKKHTIRNMAEDMEAVDDFMRHKNIDTRRVIVTGESMGGALAALMTEIMHERGHPPKMLGLVNTFSDMSRALHEQVIRVRFGKCQPLKAASYENFRERFANPLDTVKTVANLSNDTKLYVAHTPKDELMGLEHTQRVLKAGQDHGMDNTFRVLVGPFLRPLSRQHTAWDPKVLVEDMDNAFHGRDQAITRGK